MRFINLTPHDVVLYSMASVSRGRLHPGQKPVMTIPASGGRGPGRAVRPADYDNGQRCADCRGEVRSGQELA